MQNDEIATAWSNVVNAINTDNTQLFTETLEKYSLLRHSSISTAMLSDPTKLQMLIRMRLFFSLLTQAKSPQMIYSMLAAGFSVFDLAAIFKSQNAHKALIILTNILPRLTEREIAKLDPTGVPLCIYSWSIANIPVNALRAHYDLLNLFKDLKPRSDNDILSYTFAVGYRNEFFLHDSVELDVELLQKLLKQLPASEGDPNKRCLTNIQNDLDAFNNNIATRLSDIRFKSYCITTYCVFVVCFLFFGDLNMKKYLITLPQEEAERLWYDYYKLVNMASLLLQATLLPGALYMALKKHEFDILRATKKLELTPAELAFDYNAAQQRLLKDIPTRFAKEFAAEKKPASLLFWQQAYNARVKDQLESAPTQTPPKPQNNNRSLLFI